MVAQQRLDFTGIDARAANLKQAVGASQMLKLSTGEPSGQSAAFEEASTGDAAQCIGNEMLGSYIGMAMVTFGQRVGGGMEFSRNSHGQKSSVRI
jgi:hypothetical protein